MSNSTAICSRRSLLLGAAATLAVRPAAAQVGAVRCCGRRLCYREYGEPTGRPVIYCHGMPGSRLEPELIEAEIAAAGLRMIGVNRPGIGGSEHAPRRTVLDWPATAACVADSLGIGDFSLLGVSGGTPFALAAALCLGSRVRRVAIVSGHAPFQQGLPKGNQDTLVQVVKACPLLGRTAFSLMRGNAAKKPDELLQSLTKSWTEADRQLVLCNPRNKQGFLTNLQEAFCQPRGLALDIGLLAQPWGFAACRVQCQPVGIWHGCCDELVPPSHAQYLHRQIRGSQLTLDPSSSHVTTLKRHAPDFLAFLAEG